MAKELPALSEAVLAQVQKVAKLEKVQKALEIAKRDVQRAMDEQVELCEIPAPTFMEEKRAQSVLERMKAYGLTDVRMDDIGNVIGVRKGTVEDGPILVLGAHMDSVFSIDTDVTVKKDGIRVSVITARAYVLFCRFSEVWKKPILRPRVTFGLWVPWVKKATAISAVPSIWLRTIRLTALSLLTLPT